MEQENFFEYPLETTNKVESKILPRKKILKRSTVYENKAFSTLQSFTKIQEQLLSVLKDCENKLNNPATKVNGTIYLSAVFTETALESDAEYAERLQKYQKRLETKQKTRIKKEELQRKKDLLQLEMLAKKYGNTFILESLNQTNDKH